MSQQNSSDTQSDLEKSGFSIEWANEEHSVILVEYPKNWTMARGYDALDRIADLVDKTQVKEVTVIFNLIEAGLPEDATKHFRRLIGNRFVKHPKVQRIISIVGNRPLAEVPLRVFSQLNAIYKGKEVKPARTLEEAYKMAGISKT